MIMKMLLEMQEYSAAGMYEEPGRSLFYRKALGLLRFYENCAIPVYNGEALYPSGKVSSPDYMTNFTFNINNIRKRCPEAANQIQEDFCRYRSSVPSEHRVAGNMWTHSMPNYERILKEGFSSYVLRIQKIQDKDMREGLLLLIEGIRTYVERCVRYLESVNAETKLIAALKRVPMNPAENIYEAIVSWNFILYLDNCDNLGCVAAGLLPYHRGEDITELIKNLYRNLDINGGYSMALSTDYNPLTLQCLEASKGKRRPMIELFVDENTPDEVWEKAFEVIKSSNGQPAFYNSKKLLGGLKKRFDIITDEDIKKFCGGGCTESMLAGLSNVGSIDAGLNLPLILESHIKDSLEAADSFEAFYNGYIDKVRDVLNTVTDEVINSQRARAEYNPVPMRTLLIDDCIDNGLDYNNGGARYKWSIINFAGLVNTIDSLLVIRDFVFTYHNYTPKAFITLLAENNAEFLSEVKKHPVCYGCDNNDANAFSKRISTDIYSMLDHKKPFLGEGFLPCSIQFMSQVDAGKNVGATPDGRTAHSPLADSLGAIFGKDIKGPTALLNSVPHLNLDRALGTPVLNFNINPNFKTEVLKALILGYMEQGGIQIQMTCISRELLEEAYRNPEDHKNLVVRVGGYSEYFYRLSDELKRMVIERTIQNEV